MTSGEEPLGACLRWQLKAGWEEAGLQSASCRGLDPELLAFVRTKPLLEEGERPPIAPGVTTPVQIQASHPIRETSSGSP